jgi:hypothetical protein
MFSRGDKMKKLRIIIGMVGVFWVFAHLAELTVGGVPASPGAWAGKIVGICIGLAVAVACLGPWHKATRTD